MDSLYPVTLSKQQMDREPISVQVFEMPQRGQLESGWITAPLKLVIPRH